MARAKAKKDKEVETKQDEPEFVGPPLIPGRPAFWRWIGYFKVGPGDTVKDIKEWRKRSGGA